MITHEIRILIHTDDDEAVPLCTSDIVAALIRGGLCVENGIPALIVSKPKPLKSEGNPNA